MVEDIQMANKHMKRIKQERRTGHIRGGGIAILNRVIKEGH